MENYDNNIQFEEMRAQLGLLKEKLKGAQLVNDRLLRKSMSQKVVALNRQVIPKSIAGVTVCLLFLPFMRKELDMSWWLLGYTALMMIVSLLATLWYHRGLKPDMMNGNMVEVAQRIRKLKHDYEIWPYIGYPMGGIWLVWFVSELSGLMDGRDSEYVSGMWIGGVVGFLLGAIIGWILNRKHLNMIDDLIKDAEMMNENEQK